MSTTQQRTIQARIPQDIWDAARAKADSRGTTVSTLIRGWLIQYVNDEPHTPAA